MSAADDMGAGLPGIGAFEAPSAPDTLASDGSELWSRILEEYELDSSGLVLLEGLCSAFDRLRQAERLLLEAGSPVVLDRFKQEKPHPAVAIERDARIAVARLIRELDLTGEVLPAPRPPRLGGR